MEFLSEVSGPPLWPRNPEMDYGGIKIWPLLLLWQLVLQQLVLL